MIGVTGSKYTKQSFFFSVVFGLCFLLFGKRDVCRGIILGCIFSIVNFVLLKQHLHSRIGKPKNKAVLLAAISIVIRYFVMALPLFLSIRFDRFSTSGVVLGLFAVQLVILYDHLYVFLFPPEC